MTTIEMVTKLEAAEKLVSEVVVEMSKGAWPAAILDELSSASAHVANAAMELTKLLPGHVTPGDAE